MNETMGNTIPTFLKGYFLMASPSLADPNFKRSVTCLSEHTQDGAVGIVINHLHEGLDAKAIFDELNIHSTPRAKKIPVYAGGPVHVNELFVLHSKPLEWEGSLVINDDLAMSNSHTILEAIANEQGPGSFIIALGCAGWGPGQLEWELTQNAWLTGLCNHEIMFKTPVEARWEFAIRELGIDPHALSDTAGHA
jgi:putative transcriptional regulator